MSTNEKGIEIEKKIVAGLVGSRILMGKRKS